ncbi:glycosyltransferase domain-containing protein [Pontivivens ytuae]|uniref:DUF616 domain-containing protein n=1 Tax=Pontivivens ytuae TaxID=2789856 RepID=A0A7S9LVC3_9RHOB|nr:glycosyltransferase domain-containing protein [Pontivivens ytuae]QPH55934.1 DUF616 domain-containing protein [Pontivivens ytuae]
MPDGVRSVRVEANGLPPGRLSRRYKLAPHLALDDYDWTIYLDNRAKLSANPHEIVADMQERGGGAFLGLFAHPERTCVYEEARVVRRKKPVNKKRLDEQVAVYRSAGMPADVGLYAGTFLVRPRADARAAAFALRWYEEFLLHSERDQLGLAFLSWLMNVKPYLFEGQLTDNRFFRWPVISNRARRQYQASQMPIQTNA